MKHDLNIKYNLNRNIYIYTKSFEKEKYSENKILGVLQI